MSLAYKQSRTGDRSDSVDVLVGMSNRLPAKVSQDTGELLRAVFDSSAVGAAVLTTEARFLQVNKAFSAMTGYPEAELSGLEGAALTHPEDREQMRRQMKELLAGNIPAVVLEQRCFRKNGVMIWVQNSLSLTRDANNQPTHILSLCQDITERKRSEAQLVAELADTQLLRDISAHLIAEGDEQALHERLVDAVAVIMRSDFATMQMFYPKRGLRGELHLLASRGLTPEGEKLWEWVRFDTDSTCGQALRTGTRAIASDVRTSDFLRGTAGGAALLDAGIHAAQSTPLYSRSGNFMGMISSHWLQPHTPTERDLRLLDILARQAADLIERKRAEDELRRANRDLEQFAYTASHDLQEPLRTIKIYSQLLEARCGEMLTGEPAVYLDFLRKAATRMETLVRDLLAYTQIETLPAKAEKCDAGEVLADAITNLDGAIRECGATVTVNPLPVVSINETHLRQLFQNLIGNAVKYRHPGRACTVHIGAERQEGNWTFSIRDNGIGIEPQYREQIFGLFKRLHGSDTHTGTGLGLAICKRIVERYHGRIWVDSEPGQGSEFRFTLSA